MVPPCRFWLTKLSLLLSNGFRNELLSFYRPCAWFPEAPIFCTLEPGLWIKMGRLEQEAEIPFSKKSTRRVQAAK